MPGDRYSLEPLLRRMTRFRPLTDEEVCVDLPIALSTFKQHRREGVSWLVADRLAVRAGLHPALVWPEWVDDALTVPDRIFLESGWRQAWLWNEQRREAAAA